MEKQNGETLQKNQEEISDYQYVLDVSSIVAITDQKGIIKYVNDNFCAISKYSKAELIGRDHRIINSGYHSKDFMRHLWATIGSGNIWKGELKNKAKDGTIYWVDTTIVPFLNKEKKPFQYVAIRSDITERKRVEENLKESLKEIADYKYALEESSIVAITDQKGSIKYANDNFCKISKYSREELIGQDHRIINSGFHNKDFIRTLWVTIAHGEIWKGELKNKAKDGTIYWVDTTIVPFLNDEGKPYQYVAIRADITERKKAEENLKKSLKEVSDYKYALEESSIVAVTDQKGIIKYANDNFCRISKYNRDELIGQDHRIINSGFHDKDFIRNLWVTIARGKVWKGELKNKAKDGSIYWVDTTIVPFLNEEGKPYQYLAIRADITDRKSAEEKIAQSEKIYKTIASSIPGSVITLFDPEFRYLLIEGDMLEKAGYKKSSLLGKKAEDALSPERFAFIKPAFERVFKGESFSVETHRAGYEFINHFVPLKNEQNEVYMAMSVAIDVTELKKVHRDISELNASLEQKIAKRTTELELANKELEAFSYSVAHDLRTPLRAIAGYSNILVEDYGGHFDEEGQRLVGELLYNNKKMGILIDDLLTFSRLGRKIINKSLVDMNELVEDVLNDLPQHTAKIVIQELYPIDADASLLKNVMTNLLSNAVKYSSKKENATVEIFCVRKESANIYSVRDNGVGFDMAYAKKLFGVFQRLHSDEEFEGTGVGLAIVQRIIHRHGGTVWAEAQEGLGATFSFMLPDENIARDKQQ